MSSTTASPAKALEDPKLSSRRWLTLTTVALAQLMVVLDSTVVNIALPSAQKDLGFSSGDRQWIITAYSLAFGSLLLLGGRLSDLMGRKRTFIIGLIGFAAASALGGAAGSFGMLVFARALQGAFGALLAPTALAVLTTTFTIPKERARAFGIFGAIAGAGGAVGLLLGGVLTENFNWRWNLYINVFIAIFAVIGAIIFVSHTSNSGPRPKLDIPGTLLVSGALFSLVYGFSNAESDGWGSPKTWGFLIAAGVLLISFIWWQRRAAHPILPLKILADRNRAASYISVLIAGVGMFGIFLFVTYFVQTSLHYSPIQTGVGFLPMIGMLVLAAQLSTNFLLPRLGPKIMVPAGMLLAMTGMIFFTRLNLDSTYAADLLPALMITGFGMGTMMPASMQTATFGVDRQYAGVASAMVNTSQQVGGSIGTALLNTLAATAATNYIADHQPMSQLVVAQAAVHSYSVAYWWSAGFFALGAVLAALLFRRRGQGLTLSDGHSGHDAVPSVPANSPASASVQAPELVTVAAQGSSPSLVPDHSTSPAQESVPVHASVETVTEAIVDSSLSNEPYQQIVAEEAAVPTQQAPVETQPSPALGTQAETHAGAHAAATQVDATPVAATQTAAMPAAPTQAAPAQAAPAQAAPSQPEHHHPSHAVESETVLLGYESSDDFDVAGLYDDQESAPRSGEHVLQEAENARTHGRRSAATD